jgi:DNA-binding beta-propeller fold protein YncE
MRTLRLGLAALALAACHHRRPAPELPVRPEQPPPSGAQVPPPTPPVVVAPSPVPATTYRLLATAESADQVALIAFKPCQPAEVPPECGVRVERTYDVGRWPLEIEGPHGVVASPDGKSFYVSIAHGRPTGFLEKYDLATGRRIGRVQLGMFPATIDVSPNGSFVYVINFNFDDPEMQPSSVSVVEADSMTEVARTETCRMPHGSRLNPEGTLHYSGCMMNDLLVEVDARTMAVRRLFKLVPGAEGPVSPAAAPAGMSNACSPTWAQPSADGSRVYVACNRSGEIVAVDVASWRLVQRWKTPAAPYNLAVTPNGKQLVVTQKGPGTITIWRLSDDSLMAQIRGTRTVASGVAVSRDSRYAFVTLEGVGGDPGTVDIIDLQTLQKVASVEIGKQAGGIWVLQ